MDNGLVLLQFYRWAGGYQYLTTPRSDWMVHYRLPGKEKANSYANVPSWNHSDSRAARLPNDHRPFHGCLPDHEKQETNNDRQRNQRSLGSLQHVTQLSTWISDSNNWTSTKKRHPLIHEPITPGIDRWIKSTCMKRRDQSLRCRSTTKQVLVTWKKFHGHVRMSAEKPVREQRQTWRLDSWFWTRTSRTRADQAVTQQMVSWHSRKWTTLLFGSMSAIHLTEMSYFREIWSVVFHQNNDNRNSQLGCRGSSNGSQGSDKQWDVSTCQSSRDRSCRSDANKRSSSTTKHFCSLNLPWRWKSWIRFRTLTSPHPFVWWPITISL